MQYAQPFDQPGNPNAPYINGNEAAGIQGSIIPAAGIEFDQREIIEVINQANSRGYLDFTATPCATPSNSDLTQLRKAIEGFVDAYVIDNWRTYTCGPTGTFPSFLEALQFLSRYRITHNGFVTLQHQAGRFNYGTTGILVDHPNANRIVLQGATMTQTPDSTFFPITGSTTAQRTNDRAVALANMRNCFATEIDFSGGAGIVVTGPGGVTIDALLCVGDRTGPVQNAGLAVWSTLCVVKSAAFHNFGGFGLGGYNAKIIVSTFLAGVGSIKSGVGLADCGAILSNGYLIASSNDYDGCEVGFDSSLRCNGQGYFLCAGNGNNGIDAFSGGMIESPPYSAHVYNANYGANSNLGGKIFANNCFLQHNATGGAFAQMGSSIEAAQSSIDSNTTYAAVANVESCIDLTGAAITGTVVPSFNIAGSSNSIITH
jgi:hypothetical protein